MFSETYDFWILAHVFRGPRFFWALAYVFRVPKVPDPGSCFQTPRILGLGSYFRRTKGFLGVGSCFQRNMGLGALAHVF